MPTISFIRGFAHHCFTAPRDSARSKFDFQIARTLHIALRFWQIVVMVDPERAGIADPARLVFQHRSQPCHHLRVKLLVRRIRCQILRIRRLSDRIVRRMARRHCKRKDGARRPASTAAWRKRSSRRCAIRIRTNSSRSSGAVPCRCGISDCPSSRSRRLHACHPEQCRGDVQMRYGRVYRSMLYARCGGHLTASGTRSTSGYRYTPLSTIARRPFISP